MTTNAPDACPVCGSTTFAFQPVLPPALIADWRLAPEEVAYIDRQQGFCCTTCWANLRSMRLARTLCQLRRWPEPLNAATPRTALAILEINEAGALHPALAKAPGHVFAAYPEVDMQNLPYPDESFDIVVHSDTLEHVPQPIRALAECRRVLKPGGACCFTVPVVVGRLSSSREGLPPSYHGDPEASAEDFVVHTEFGADVWTYALRAGFSRVAVDAFDYPAATAWTAWR